MKKIDILNVRLDQLVNEDSLLELRRNKLRNRMQNEQKLILEKYFGTSYEGFKLDIGKERVSVIKCTEKLSLYLLYTTNIKL